MSAFLSPKLPASAGRPCRSPNHPVCTVPPPQSSSPTLQRVADRLQEELPTLFSPASPSDYSIYSDDVTFEDPLTKFRGIAKYASNIKFLNNSPVFSDACLTVHDTSIISSNTVRTRWTLSMSVKLPWAPCVAFTGQSDYVVDLETGYVVQHFDYWDSLQDSKFFSFPAVLDLIAQCRPHVGSTDLGGFDLLRRTPQVQLRRFHTPVMLKKDHHSAVEAWKPATDGQSVSLVAVSVLETAPRTQQEIDHTSNRLKHLLKGHAYATPGSRCYYVCPTAGGNLFHEIWLELTDASAVVDT